jgi:hypothetical protein
MNISEISLTIPGKYSDYSFVQYDAQNRSEL